MADVLKYGWVYGGKIGQEMPLAANQWFDRKGGAFVTASGNVGGKQVLKLVTAHSQDIVGWAEVPRAAVPGLVDYWSSGSVSGANTAHVITDPSAHYALPAWEGTASLAASIVGLYTELDIQASIQYAEAAPSGIASRMQIFVVDVDLNDKIIYGRVNPGHLQV